jgi:hypothetical protein
MPFPLWPLRGWAQISSLKGRRKELAQSEEGVIKEGSAYVSSIMKIRQQANGENRWREQHHG